jgi:hypothetical protein
MRRWIAILSTALLLATAGVAHAGVPTEVDQATLQPPLNPNFTYRCFREGDGILCQGIFDSAWTSEDTGLTCGSEPILTTGSGHERLQRWHLADGRAYKTIGQLHYDETWTLPSTGRTVELRGDWNRHYTYLVPGVRAQRVLTEVGSSFKITAPGVGLVAHDVGLIRFAPGEEFETPVLMHGPHDTWQDFDGVLDRVCAVLMD